MLSRTAEYALRAMVCMAHGSLERINAQRMAQMTQIPRRYLHKVLQDLVTARLAVSSPGPGGGYSLAREAGDISILDVVDAVDPIERITRCPLGLTSHATLCPLHQELDKAYASVRNALSRVSLRQLVSSSNKIVPLCDVGMPTDES